MLRHLHADDPSVTDRALRNRHLTARSGFLPSIPGNLPGQAACEILPAVVCNPDPRLHRLVRHPGVFLKLRQRKDIPEERFKALRLRKSIRLWIQVTVEHPHERRSLPRKVLQSQERNACQILRSEIGLHFLPVASQRQFPGRLHPLLPGFCHTGRPTLPADRFKIIRARHSLEILNLRKVRKHLILSDLKGDDRPRILRAKRTHRVVIVHALRRFLFVHMPFHSGKASAQRQGLISLRRIEIAVRIAAERPVMRIRGIRIQPRGILCPRALQHFPHSPVSLFPGMQFIAEGQHDKGRMVGEHVQRPVQFIQVVCILCVIFERIARIPAGQFRLHEHAQTVCRSERGFRRHMRVEAHAVDAVASVGSEDPVPGSQIHWLIAGLRKNRTVGFRPEMDHTSVDGKMPVPRAEIAHAEGHRHGIQAFSCGRQRIEFTCSEIPSADVFPKRKIPDPERLSASLR